MDSVMMIEIRDDDWFSLAVFLLKETSCLSRFDQNQTDKKGGEFLAPLPEKIYSTIST